MSRNLSVVFFAASIFSSQISFAASIKSATPGGTAPMSLDALVNGDITVHLVLRSGLSVNNLISDYLERQDLNAREKKQFLNQYKSKINGFLTKEAAIKPRVPQSERQAKTRHFRNFFGNADLAINANPEELEFYERVRNTLLQLGAERILNKEPMKACLFNLGRLRHLHKNNYQISQELAQYGYSRTYGKKPTLHFGDEDLNFELKADMLFDTLKKAFLFAERRQLLSEMFTEFAEATGCLEARFARLSSWHQEQSVRERISLPPQHDIKNETLEVTAAEAVNIWMHAHRHEFYAMPEIKGETRKGFVSKIHRAFGGAEGCDGQRITPNFVQRLFEKVLFLTPESSLDSADSSGADLE